jgi:hypothetical protein
MPSLEKSIGTVSPFFTPSTSGEAEKLSIIPESGHEQRQETDKRESRGPLGSEPYPVLPGVRQEDKDIEGVNDTHGTPGVTDIRETVEARSETVTLGKERADSSGSSSTLAPMKTFPALEGRARVSVPTNLPTTPDLPDYLKAMMSRPSERMGTQLARQDEKGEEPSLSSVSTPDKGPVTEEEPSEAALKERLNRLLRGEM